MLRMVLLAPTSPSKARLLMLAVASEDSADEGGGDKTDPQPSPQVEKTLETPKAKPTLENEEAN